MWIKFRHRVVFTITRPFIWLYLRIKYRFHTKRYKLPKGPHIFLFNHPTNLDPFMMALAFDRPIYFIANDDIFNIPYVSKLIRYLVAPIPKTKAIKDITTIKTSLKVIKEGGSIGVSPEGNRNYSGRINNIDMAIVKFIRFLKAPVVLYRICGGFGVNPRFSKRLRKGKMVGELARIISVEEVEKYNDQELLDLIIKELDVDDTKLGYEYLGEALAEDMESVFYVCPSCHALNQIYSSKHKIGCRHCGMQADYTRKLTFKTDDEEKFPFKTVNEYYVYQEDYVNKLDVENIVYKDKGITLKEVIKNKRKNTLLTGLLSFNKEELSIANSDDKKVIKVIDIISLAIVYHNTLIINLANTTYQVVGNSKFNALKYLHLIHLIRNKKQGVENGFLGL